MLRVCVIGMGPIGRRHATLLQAEPLAELVGVCDRIPERANTAEETFGVPAFLDAKTMLSDLAPDVAHVTTGGVEYGSDHYEPTMQALEAGCHVLGEKPISNEIEEAGEMVATARERGLCYGINLNHRFTPAARVARGWVDEGRIGHQLFCRMSMWIMNPTESSPWFQVKALNPHTVDVMRYFCGDIEQVQLFATKAPGRKIWSTTSFNMRFTSGAVGNLTASYDIERGHPMERCEVGGTEGRFVLDDMWREATLYPAGDLVKQVYTDPVFGGFGDFTSTFADRIHRFLEQVSDGTSPEDIDGSGAEGLAAQKVLAAAIVSLQEGSVVSVNGIR
ncbi:MAG: Gfo/Idh/MocA family oxidoreductase [Anaerolineaceae bacterium]|nr:Gfo/Idh/MocA family oxidoreductase [Anaerolineaceae bacterium]MCY4021873.1 Gfo/Idh/MocA family oxidoreductase [Anaerolineaceae bacterium]